MMKNHILITRTISVRYMVVLQVFLLCLLMCHCVAPVIKKPKQISSHQATQQNQSNKKKELLAAEQRWQQELERRRKLEMERTKKAAQIRQQQLEASAKLKREADQRARHDRLESQRKLALQKAKQQAARDQLEQEQRRKQEAHTIQANQAAQKAQRQKRLALARQARAKQFRRSLASHKAAGTFWFEDAQQLVQGRILAEGQEQGHVFIYANNKPLQLHGVTKSRKLWPLQLQRPKQVLPPQFDLSSNLLAQKGNWIVLQIPGMKLQGNQYHLFTIRLGGRQWQLINIFSDGSRLLHLDLEAVSSHEYRRVIVNELLIQP